MEYGEYPVHAWSRYRHQLRRQCPRKAVLNCREARLGASEDSSEFHRMVHELRRHVTAKQYVDRIFDEATRRMFYNSAPEYETSAPGSAMLYFQLTAQLERDMERIFSGAAGSDHKNFMFRELDDEKCSLTVLAEMARRQIELYCNALGKELGKIISSTPLLCRRHIASPLQLHINDLCCYCAPLLALERSGVLWIVENNCDDTIALMHKFHALNSMGREPHLVRSFGYHRESGEFYEAGREMNVSELLRKISEESGQWGELTALPLEKISVNPGHCPDCKYNAVCKKYFQL